MVRLDPRWEDVFASVERTDQGIIFRMQVLHQDRLLLERFFWDANPDEEYPEIHKHILDTMVDKLDMELGELND